MGFFGWVFYWQPWPKAKYTFCCAPINRRMPFVNTMFLKMARQFSRGDVISFDWLCSQVPPSEKMGNPVLGRIRILFGPDPDREPLIRILPVGMVQFFLQSYTQCSRSYVFGPPGSRSVIQRYGSESSESSSKIVRKPLISTVL